MMNDQPHPPSSTNSKLLTCDRCEYSLDGLVIESGSVTCPECSCQQTLVVWTEKLESKLEDKKLSRLAWVCMIAFLVVVALMLILFLIGFALVM